MQGTSRKRHTGWARDRKKLTRIPGCFSFFISSQRLCAAAFFGSICIYYDSFETFLALLFPSLWPSFFLLFATNEKRDVFLLSSGLLVRVVLLLFRGCSIGLELIALGSNTCYKK